MSPSHHNPPLPARMAQWREHLTGKENLGFIPVLSLICPWPNKMPWFLHPHIVQESRRTPESLYCVSPWLLVPCALSVESALCYSGPPLCSVSPPLGMYSFFNFSSGSSPCSATPSHNTKTETSPFWIPVIQLSSAHRGVIWCRWGGYLCVQSLQFSAYLTIEPAVLTSHPLLLPHACTRISLLLADTHFQICLHMLAGVQSHAVREHLCPSGVFHCTASIDT